MLQGGKGHFIVLGGICTLLLFEGLSVPLLGTFSPKSFPAQSQAFVAGLKLAYTTAYNNPIFKTYFSE